jgi:S-DNA-T family DNA segregation ATPase FtsK/SpoIIIE
MFVTRPKGVALFAIAGAVEALLDARQLMIGLLAVLLGSALWCRLHPRSFDALVSAPLDRGRTRRRVRRLWPSIAISCGLSIPAPVVEPKKGEPLTRAAALVPVLRKVTTDGPRVRLLLRLQPGQTFDDVAGAAERLRTAFGASGVRVDPDGPVNARMTFTRGDVLAPPFTAVTPPAKATATPSELSSVVMGRAEDGQAWRLPLGPHTLTVGCSGSGKGSVFWCFAFGLAPAVQTGLVRLYGIDLKGGMEVLLGADLFSMRATNAAEAVVVLEQLVLRMQTRTALLAGRARTHAATVAEPLHVIMIDELAALTAYCPERDLRMRAEMAINLLCSQGRAPGFIVFACLQDPRKEVIPSRGLFTQMIGLRLKDATETSMVLGDQALTSGALCHRISRTAPGTGYVIPEDGGHPIRVRAGYASDDAIRHVAATFPTPYVEEVVVPNVEDEPRRPRSSRSSMHRTDT